MSGFHLYSNTFNLFTAVYRIFYILELRIIDLEYYWDFEILHNSSTLKNNSDTLSSILDSILLEPSEYRNYEVSSHICLIVPILILESLMSILDSNSLINIAYVDSLSSLVTTSWSIKDIESEY